MTAETATVLVEEARKLEEHARWCAASLVYDAVVIARTYHLAARGLRERAMEDRW